jgi:hypothetical protein
MSGSSGVMLRHGYRMAIVVELGNMNPHATPVDVMKLSGLTCTQLAACLQISRESLSRLIHRTKGARVSKRTALAAVAVAMCAGVTISFRDPFNQLGIAAKTPVKTSG